MGGYAARYNQHGGITVRELDAEFPKAEDARLEWPVVIHWTSCTGGNNPQPPAVQQPRSRPARRRPTVQPPLWGTR
jgi:hypothetical protein